MSARHRPRNQAIRQAEDARFAVRRAIVLLSDTVRWLAGIGHSPPRALVKSLQTDLTTVLNAVEEIHRTVKETPR